jgi:uncharacterized protein YbaP (TraB family)
MISLRTAALALVALAACACGPKPALWKTGDADTTVYFLGTVHVLPPTLDWRTPAIDKALGEAKAVYFETDIEPDPSTITMVLLQVGMYPPGETLSDRLKPDDRAALAAAAEQLGISMVVLDQMRPWLAATTLGQLAIGKAGFDPSSGVERSLFPDARAASKEIRKFETVEEQLHTFSDLPETVQMSFLMDGLRELGDESETLNEMVDAWAAGDTGKLNTIMIEGDLGEMPEIYTALLVERNARWVPKLDQLIKTEPGTFLVAVGTAHLIGKDSVLEMMKPLGYTVERVE